MKREDYTGLQTMRFNTPRVLGRYPDVLQQQRQTTEIRDSLTEDSGFALQ